MITGRNMNVIAVLKIIPWREHAMAPVVTRHRMHGAHARQLLAATGSSPLRFPPKPKG